VVREEELREEELSEEELREEELREESLREEEVREEVPREKSELLLLVDLKSSRYSQLYRNLPSLTFLNISRISCWSGLAKWPTIAYTLPISSNQLCTSLYGKHACQVLSVVLCCVDVASSVGS
jgi:hypothetical protein